MSKPVTLTIDGRTVTMPEGTYIVDAAKQAGIDIPVFCHHPKLQPVGMCRMCLVEIGRPLIDRSTGQPVLEADGKPRIQFGPKLETACTTPISEGMVVITQSEKVTAARKDVLEFLLTSHPLDCPVCDKGGECPLQNLTMRYGPGEGRFLFDEKHRAAKHVPLGELIFLDRERCIQCARCVRFQDELAGDAVIGFYNRGRKLEIVTYSEPGFDSVFSGNTTDICPVGALTTADFRFGARPWELKATASLCSHCPVGCNIIFDVRREAQSGGKTVIKRVMPRQNEAVNEIWICDKGRFAYHYTESPQRLTQPLVRLDGELTPSSWEIALEYVAESFREAGKGLLALGGGRLSNEDLFNLGQLSEGLGGQSALYTFMDGGDLTAQVGMSAGTNLGALGAGTVVLVVASDLYEEAPLWYLRLKQAAARGAQLIVANGRATKLDRYATHTIRYVYGQETATVLELTKGGRLTADDRGRSAIALAAAAIAQAENLIVFYGSDGLGLAGSTGVARACAGLLQSTGHVGRPNNGLIGVWQKANEQGAWELGLRPLHDLAQAVQQARALYVVAADPFGDDPELAAHYDPLKTFLVVQDLFLTETARHADVVLPAQAFTEREGTFTSGERRVQRYYPAVPPLPASLPDFAITAKIGNNIGLELEGRVAAAVLARIAAQVPAFAGLSYQHLAESTAQWPALSDGINRKGLYFSGTAYENKQGIGLLLALTPASIPLASLPRHDEAATKSEELLAVPITRLYDRGQTVWPSTLLEHRIGTAWIGLNPADAAAQGVTAPSKVWVTLAGREYEVAPHLDDDIPQGVALIPRSMGLPLTTPTPIAIRPSETPNIPARRSHGLVLDA